MSWFHTLPLKQKLILMGLLTAMLAMLLAGGLMLAAEFTAYRDSMVRDLTIKAEIIGDQCTAALLFNVKKDAEETLGALRADPNIEYAAIFTGDGTLFATYRRVGKPDTWVPGRQIEGYQFGVDYLALFRRIVVHDRHIGGVLIQSDLGKIQALLFRFITAAGVVLLVSLLVAYVLVSRLQSAITRPVVDLVRMMEGVSQDKDFSVRAEGAGSDELGALARGFNTMVSTIQDRDRELDAHRKDLERTVSDLERSTEELQEANRKLKALDKLKSDFISVVSHELRTPLTSIKAFVELILMKPNMPEQRKAKLLVTINTESDRLARLINDLLDLSRIESGAMTWRLQNVDLPDIISSSVALIMPLVQNKEQKLSMNIEANLPQAWGDRDRLIQVVNNILSNAVKFTPRSGSISISAFRQSGAIMVSVSDTGTGIPQEDLEIIFDKFQRSGDHLTSTEPGTGLGLAIAREIIGLHRGAIWAESTYGVGSKFTFTLPLNRAGAG